MKIIKTIFKTLFVGILLIVVIAAAIAVYMEFYGKQLLEAKLSSILGTKLKFKGFSLDISKYSVSFKGFTIPREVGFESRSVFSAEKFIVLLNKEKFEREKKITISEIIVEKGVFNIERNEQGIFNIADSGREEYPKDERGLAYAQGESSGASLPIYNFAKNVKRLLIKNSRVNFKDRYISSEPYLINCSSFNANITTAPENEASYGSIPMKYKLSLKIPRGSRASEVSLEGNAAVYKEKVDTELTMEARDIDVMQLLPYFNNYTPFTFYGGEFDSDTKAAMHNNTLNCLTTMAWHNLDLAVDQGRENTTFLEASVKKLAPYLTSGGGETIFDFVIKGPLDKPEMGIGPKVKMAIGMSMMDEVSDILQRLQKLKK